jgi:xanthine dehydrogenase accessory factor
MNKNLATWQLIYKSLQSSIPVMLLYVLESKGSSPGRQGFFMAVNASEEMQGSIGGGIMEHKFVELAKELLAKQQDISILRKQLHDKKAAQHQSGMICSGEQTIWIYRMRTVDQQTIEQIITSLEHNSIGSLFVSASGLAFTAGIHPAKDFQFSMTSDDDWSYVEKIGYKNQLFIIGGGHCSLALSKLMRTLDFYIRVYDDRHDLNTVDQNEFAHETIQLNSYETLGELIPDGKEQHYVVIMTFGYRTDDIALRALLNKRLRYLGILGSASKIGDMFNAYEASGISRGTLASVHAPIGIRIKSQTPEEIAISIAAEIILEKNKNYS